MGINVYGHVYIYIYLLYFSYIIGFETFSPVSLLVSKHCHLVSLLVSKLFRNITIVTRKNPYCIPFILLYKDSM